MSAQNYLVFLTLLWFSLGIVAFVIGSDFQSLMIVAAVHSTGLLIVLAQREDRAKR